MKKAPGITTHSPAFLESDLQKTRQRKSSKGNRWG
jgi:hypothetical protein